MRYLALATDYDGTLAHNGTVSETTLRALRRLRETGRKLILVTGRQLPELQQDFDHLQLFDLAVVENGAVLHHPETEKTTALADPPDRGLVQMLRERNVGFLSVGEVIVASHEPFEKVVLEAIHDLGLEYQVIFNKGAVMVLPTGINKATGLRAALAELGLSRHNVVGIGDAENDHAFLDICGCAAVVANALPALRQKADLVTREDHGAGVRELVEHMMNNDLADVALRRPSAGVDIGTASTGDQAVLLSPTENLLVAGSSGGGKSTLVSGLAERAINRDFQTVVIDPEGDHAELIGTLVLGSPKRPPTVEEVAQAFENPDQSVVANLVAVRVEDQPHFLQRLLPFVHELRARTGRPHFLILDEAHHLLPPGDAATGAPAPLELKGLLAATVEPHHVMVPLLQTIDHLLVTGSNPQRTIEKFCDDATWLFHLRNGDVSRWMEEQVKDPDLAATVASIEAECAPDPVASRERVRREIEKRYTGSV